jgi:phage gp36-like protein
MGPYIQLGDLQGMIPPKFLREGLDDDGDGEPEPSTVALVLQQASDMVDACLEGRYQTPFTNPIPKIVFEAAKIFACELIHQRRGVAADQNPFVKQANQYRDPGNGILTQIAAGTRPLFPTLKRELPSASAVTARSKTASTTGLAT